MITPGIWDVHIYRNNDFSFVFDILVDGNVLDLTGSSVYAQMRQSPEYEGSSVDYFTVKVDGTLVTNPATTNNEIELSLTETETLALDAGEYYYDVLVVTSTGVRTTYLIGKAFVHETVTEIPA